MFDELRGYPEEQRGRRLPMAHRVPGPWKGPCFLRPRRTRRTRPCFKSSRARQQLMYTSLRVLC